MLCIRNDIFYYSFDFKSFRISNLEFMFIIRRNAKGNAKENVFDRVIIGPFLRYGSQYNDPMCGLTTCVLM